MGIRLHEHKLYKLVTIIYIMRKEHREMLTKYTQLCGYFAIEEGKYVEQKQAVPPHVRDALSIIRLK